MRNELALLELVDRYLDGVLDVAERTAFEQRLAESAELRALLEDQRVLREGVARAALRPAVAKAYRAHRFGKWKPWLGGAGAVVLAVAGATLWMQRPVEHHEAPEVPVVVDSNITACDSLEPVGEEAPPSSIRVDTTVDTVYRVLRHGQWETFHSAPADSIATMKVRSESGRAVTRTSLSRERSPLPVRMEPVETKPEFPGGMGAFYEFLEANIRHPDLEMPVSGAVEVGFTINAEGRVEDVQVVKGLNAAYNAEAIRVIRAMPPWKPGRENGKPVPCRLQMPMEFRNPGAP